MRPHRRTVAALACLTLAGVGLLGLTACQRPAASEAGPADAAAVDVAAGAAADLAGDLAGDLEGQALAALGFAPAELPAQEPSPEASPAGPGDERGERGKRRQPLRRAMLRGRVLHAEAVVQTKEGVRTVLSQRGEITAIDGDSVTVKSADGFSLTWAFGKDLRVVERRRTVQPADLAVGTEIGVAGAREDDGAVARLIIRPAKQ
jgi:hypothetical protein